jgi:hypothetical protein
VIAIEAVRHDGFKRNASRMRLLDERQGDLRLGTEGWVLLAQRQPRLGRVGLRVQRPVAALVGPQRRHGYDPVVDLAARANVLACHVRRGMAVLAVARVVKYEHAARVRGQRRLLGHQRQALCVDGFSIPVRFAQEELQPLHRRGLGLYDRLGTGQRRERLVAVVRQQQSSEVGPEAAPLGQRVKEVVKPLGVVLKGTRRRRTRAWSCHGNDLLRPGAASIVPAPTNYR